MTSVYTCFLCHQPAPCLAKPENCGCLRGVCSTCANTKPVYLYKSCPECGEAFAHEWVSLRQLFSVARKVLHVETFPENLGLVALTTFALPGRSVFVGMYICLWIYMMCFLRKTSVGHYYSRNREILITCLTGGAALGIFVYRLFSHGIESLFEAAGVAMSMWLALNCLLIFFYLLGKTLYYEAQKLGIQGFMLLPESSESASSRTSPSSRSPSPVAREPSPRFASPLPPPEEEGGRYNLRRKKK